MNLLEQDKHHRQLALDASKSFIVQAPAGSGKTELLIQRFLTLLTQVKAPEEILAITFTKKAANEMRSRVIKALKNALNEPEPESAHAKQTWLLAKKVLQHDKQYQWNLISNPNQLRIQTIDSLCSHLTKQLPLLSHFGSQPDIADTPAFLYREAVHEVLMHVEENYEWSQALTHLLLHLDNDLNKLHDLLVSLLAKRDQWLSYISLNSSESEVRITLENQLGWVITDALENLKSIFPKNLAPELLAIARFAASYVNTDSDILACQNLTQLPGTTPEEKQAWKGLATLFLTKDFSWRKRVNEDIGFPPVKNFKNPQEIALHTEYRQRYTAIVNSLSDYENIRLALIDIFHLPEYKYSDKQWDILQSLLQVLKIVAAQLRLVFQQHGKIDFIENTQAALSALGNDDHPTDLALALDYHIQHILIDEFQDTSSTQYQLLKKLTTGWEKNDGRTLFVVGDPMQSIYKFREAEVGLFIRMRSEGLQHIELIPLTLAVNFRSTPAIVEWNNATFNKIFPQTNNIATGAVSYSPSVSNNTTPIAEADKVISVRGFVNTDNDDAEANAVIDTINKTKAEYPADKIAILVRSRPHLAAIIPALKKAGISYRAIDIDPLASRQNIQDLLSLTCALLHPADRIAWLSVLRAPWCGLSLADLLIIGGSDRYAAIFTQLQNQDLRAKLSADGRSRIEKIYPVLSAKIAARERSSLRAWVESTWLLLGGPAYLNNYSDIDDVNAFFQLLDKFSASNQVLNLDKLKERINQLFASTQHDDATVQIMTIHTAKGLEFDTVILPKLERKTPHDDKSLLLWIERPRAHDQVALLLAPIHATGTDKDPTYEYISKQQKIKSDYETDRLLYVAATRAKKRLHIFFNITRNDKNEYRTDSGSFLGKIWPQLEKYGDNILSDADEENNKTLDEKENRLIQRLKSSWINPIKEITLASTASHKQTSGFQLTDHTARLIGTATHKILQIISQTQISWWINKSAQEKNAYLSFTLRQLGVSQEHLGYAVSAVSQSLENTLTDERGKWILQAHDNAKSEFAITAVIEGKIENLVIDRTFIDGDTLWIIDYKTATLSQSDVEAFLAKEEKKYRAQMQKYHQALKSGHEGDIKMGLYFPALPAWYEM